MVQATRTSAAPLALTNKEPWGRADLIQIAILLLSCGGLFFFGLGAHGLIDPGDGYFTEAAREMVESGDYITPHLNYQIYFSKPILIFWLISSAYHVFGINEFAGRIWSAILATALVLCVYWFGRCLGGRRVGLMSGLILAGSPSVVTFARMSLVDMAFSSFLGIALCSLLMTICLGSKRWWPVLYATLALAVLTKGPAAIVLMGLGTLAYLLVCRPDKQRLLDWIKQLHLLWGTAIFCVIAVPWYAAVAYATKGLWVKVFFLFENLGRYAGKTNHHHPELWFYFPVLGYGFFPWTCFLPFALKDAFKNDRFSKFEPRAMAATFLACWAAAIFLFFTFSTAKLETYILPALTAFSLLLALAFEGWIKQTLATHVVPRFMKNVSAILMIVGLIVAVSSLAAGFIGKDFPLWVRLFVPLSGLFLTVGWTKQYRYLRSGNISASVAWLLMTSVVVGTLAAPVAFAIGYKYKQQDLHDIVTALQGKPGNVAIFQEFKPTLMFYLRGPIDSFFDPNQLQADKKAGLPQYVIASDKTVGLLIAAHGHKFVAVCKRGSWGLYQTLGLKLRKLPTLETTFGLNLNLNCGEYSWGTLPFAGGTPELLGKHSGHWGLTER